MEMTFMYCKVLLLLWSANLVPPLLAYIAGDKWNTPVDLGQSFRDGKPFLGTHKTIRGLLGGTAAGLCAGVFMGIPWWVALLASLLSMAGDLLSSFIKRRLSMASGSIVPGLDQGLEGFFPFLVLGPHYSLSGWEVCGLWISFCVGAYGGSWFHTRVLLREPMTDYPRPLKPDVRMRELRRCQILSNPLRYVLNFEDAIYYHLFMKTTFKALGIYEKGKENALKVEVKNLTLRFPDLPESFEGYTILYMSDLHLDGLGGLTEKLRDMVRDVRTDLCVIGGDIRMETYGPYDEALHHVHRLIPGLQAKDGVYAVLGNHDCLQMVEPLENMGMAFLINDAKAIERNGERIWIVGIDDPHHYKCENLAVAFEGVPHNAFSIFLAHSNEVYKEAARFGPRLYLCGHTHGGQIHIPPFGPIFTHSRAPRRLCQGMWKHEHMVGYTSCGVGVSGVPVRFSTKGEVLIITLSRR